MTTTTEPAATAHYLSLRPTQMAKAMGVPYSTYKKWASGANPLPTLAYRTIKYMRDNPALARQLGGVKGN